jgi:DNA-binding NtrC family response regulator
MDQMEHRPRILVADDEPQIQELLEEFLIQLGYSVRLAGDGEEVLRRLQQEFFDGALVDLKMPRLAELDLLRAIKRLYPTLPIVMMTGYPSVGVAVEAMKAGAADFVTKPLRLDELKLALNKVQRLRRSGERA